MTSTNAQTQYLRAGETAALLHVSNKTVARWALLGLLPYRLTMGGHRLYPADRIRELARSLEHEPGEEAS